MIYKRKQNKKTDYKKRLRYLLSKAPRLVIRKSNSRLYAQIIEYLPEGDKTLVSATSKELIKLGYKGSIKNTPSAYLTGVLLANKAKEKTIKTVIPDIGFHSHTKGSLIFALIKGAKDAGLDLKINDSILPQESRIKGEHISNFTKSDISKNIEEIKAKLIK